MVTKIERGFEIPVLDHGKVALIDYMGDDKAIADAARISYMKQSDGEASDTRLIRYLMRKRHTSPSEMVTVKMYAAMPIFVMRQWVRHRTASYNEISGRYTQMPEVFYVPEKSRMCYQSKSNKQMSGDRMPEHMAEEACRIIEEASTASYSAYQTLLYMGLSRELARTVLPLNAYTHIYVTVNLHNLFHFLKLRDDPHAQEEIREYARAITVILKGLFPVSCQAYEDYVKNAVTLSAEEVRAVRELLRSFPDQVTDRIVEASGLQGSEAKDFLAKLGRML